MGPNQTYKLLYSKQNHKQNKKITHKLENTFANDVTKKSFSSVQLLIPVQLFATPWTTAHQAPLPMEFSKQEYWTGPFPSPGDFPNPGIEPRSSALQADSLSSEL